MYRILACDMDETFFAHDHSIPPSNLEALRTLQETGVEFVPASGRGFASIMDMLAPVTDAGITVRYVISYNGGCITEVKTGRVLHEQPLEFSHAEYAYQFAREHGLCCQIYVFNGPVYVRGMGEAERAHIANNLKVTETDEPSLSFLGDTPIAKVNIQDCDFAHLHTLPAELGEMANAYEIAYSSGCYLELSPKDVTKGVALMRLAELLSVDICDTIAVGDSANDRAMICAAGCGVGVAGVTEDVRPCCDYICEASCNDGCLPEVLEVLVRPSLAKRS